MNDTIRYQFNPLLTDTVGFFDCCIPLTNESAPHAVDSLKKYYDFSVYNHITPAPAAKQLVQSNSVFHPHSLTPIHHSPLAIDRQNTDWVTVVFMVCLLLFAWIQTSYSKRLGQIVRAVAQPHFVNQLERDGNLFKERVSLGLGLIYFSISSVFVMQVFREVGVIPFGISNLAFAGILFAVLLVYHFLKSLLVYTLGIIFETREQARQYQLNILIFNYVMSLILFPVSLVAYYWNSIEILISGIVIISLLLLYRFFRGILTGLNNKGYNLFYLFLYLCTLEILPLLLLYKMVSKF